jgi:hypothetical protein
MPAMKLIFSSFYFTLTIAIAVAALIISGIEFPETVKTFKHAADHFLDLFSDAFLPANYALLREFVFDGKNVLLISYVIATRVVLAILRELFFPSDDYWDRRRIEREQNAGKSPFHRWGKRSS